VTNREIYAALDGLEWKQQDHTTNVYAKIPDVADLLISGITKDLVVFRKGEDVRIAYECSPLFAAVIDRITYAHWKEWLNK